MHGDGRGKERVEVDQTSRTSQSQSGQSGELQRSCLLAPRGECGGSGLPIRRLCSQEGHAAPPGQGEEKPGSEDKAEGRGEKSCRARLRIEVGGSGPCALSREASLHTVANHKVHSFVTKEHSAF